jgi:hypothetical protein
MKGMIKVTALTLGLAFGALANAADLSGTWVLTVESPQGTSNPTMTLTQDGESVSGTYSGSLGSSDISGTVDGDSFKLVANLSMQGQEIPLTYTGTQSGDSMTGSLDLAGMGGADFTGSRQQ